MSFLHSLDDYPIIKELNSQLQDNYSIIFIEIQKLFDREISPIVIEEGLLYNKNRKNKIILDKVRLNDNWTVGWDQKNWLQYPIIYEGELFESAKKNLPKICEFIEPIKDCFQTLFISTIKPFGEIPEHCDGGDKTKVYEKNRLTYHFNIDCPPVSILAIDGIEFEQKNNNYIIFDSSYRHYVKNKSNLNRTILCAKFFISKTKRLF